MPIQGFIISSLVFIITMLVLYRCHLEQEKIEAEEAKMNEEDRCSD